MFEGFAPNFVFVSGYFAHLRVSAGVVAELLSKVCGDFVRNIDKKSLNVSVWTGNVKLENLVLNKAAFDELGLPITLVEGSIKLIEFNIPLKSIQSSPVVVKLKGVNAILGPNLVSEAIPRLVRRQRDARMKVLESDLQSRRKLLTTKAGDETTWTAKLVASIVDNLIVEVEGINIRYEDSMAAPQHPFACTLTLKSFSIRTTDSNYSATPFHTDSNGTVFKEMRLAEFALYWQSDVSDQCSSDPSRLSACIRPHNLVIHPISMVGRLKMVKEGAISYNLPKVTAALEVERIELSVEPVLVRDLLNVTASISRQQSRTSMFTTVAQMQYEERSSIWWAYLRLHVRKSFRKYQRLDFVQIVQAVQDAKEYSNLFRRHLGVLPIPTLSEAEVERLRLLEAVKSNDFIASVRDTVQRSIVNERKEMVEKLHSKTSLRQSEGFFKRFSFSRTRSSSGVDGDTVEIIVGGMAVTLTEEQIAQLESMVESNAGLVVESSSEWTAPEDYVIYFVTFSLKLFCLNFKVRTTSLPQGNPEQKRLISNIAGTDVRVSAQIRKVNREVMASLGGVSVTHEAVAAAATPAMQNILYVDTHDSSSTAAAPFVDLKYDIAPLSNNADYSIRINVLPLIFVLCRAWITEMSAFRAQIKEAAAGDPEAVQQTMKAVSRGVEMARESAQSAVSKAWLHHKVVHVQCWAAAPTIVIPSFAAEKLPEVTSVLVLQLGSIRIGSADADMEYDKFAVEVSGLQILAGSEPCNWQDKSCAQSIRMLGPVTLKTELQLAIVKDSSVKTMTKVQSEIQCLELHINYEQLTHVHRVLNSLSLKPEGAHSAAPAPHNAAPKLQRLKSNLFSAISSAANSTAVTPSSLHTSKNAPPPLQRLRSKLLNVMAPAAALRKLGKTVPKLIEFKFLLRLVRIQLEETRQKILVLQADEFSSIATVRRHVTDVWFNLKQLLIEDCITQQQNKEDIGSDVEYLLEARSQRELMMSIAVQLIDKRAEEYKGIDIALTLDLQLIQIHVVDQTVRVLQRFAERTAVLFSAEKRSSESKQQSDSVSLKTSVATNTFIRVSMAELQLRLGQVTGANVTDIANATTTRLKASYEAADCEISTEFTCGSCTIVDLTKGPEERNRCVLEPFRDKHETSFLYANCSWVLARLQDAQHPKVEASLKGFRINFVPAFLARVHNFIASLRTPGEAEFPTNIESVVNTSSRVSTEKEVKRGTDSGPKASRITTANIKFGGCEIFFEESGESETGLMAKLESFDFATDKASTCDSSTYKCANADLRFRALIWRGGSMQSECVDISGKVEVKQRLISACAEEPAAACKADFKQVRVHLSLEDLIMLVALFQHTKQCIGAFSQIESASKRKGSDVMPPEVVVVDSVKPSKDFVGDLSISEFDVRLEIGSSQPVASIRPASQLSCGLRGLVANCTLWSHGKREILFQIGGFRVDFARDSPDSFALKTLVASEHEERRVRAIRRSYAKAHEIFNEFDTDRSGLDLTEFTAALKQAGHPLTVEQAQDILSSLDLDGSGTLDFEEFVKIVLPDDYNEAALVQHADNGPFVDCKYLSEEKNGHQSVDLKVGRLECLLSKEPCESLIELLSVTKYLQPQVSRDSIRTVNRMDSPIQVRGEQLRSFVKPAEAATKLATSGEAQKLHVVGFTLRIRMKAAEIGIALDGYNKSSESLLLILGDTSLDVCQEVEHMLRKLEFKVSSMEMGFSDEPLDPKTRWSSLMKETSLRWSDCAGLNGTPIETGVCPNSFDDGNRYAELKFGKVEMNVTLEQCIFLVMLARTFQTLLPAKAELDRKQSILVQSTVESTIEEMELDLGNKASPKHSVTAASSGDQGDAGFQVTKSLFRFRCSLVTLQLNDDLDCNCVPIAKLELRKIVLKLSICDSVKDNNSENPNSLTSGDGSALTCAGGLACHAWNRASGEGWEPMVEPWFLKAEFRTTAEPPSRSITLEADKRLEMTLAPDQLCTFMSAYTKCKKQFITSVAPKSVASQDAHEQDVFAEFFDHLRSNYDLINNSPQDLCMQVVSSDGDILWGGVVAAGATAHIPLVRIEGVKVRLRPTNTLNSGHAEWSQALGIADSDHTASISAMAHLTGRSVERIAACAVADNIMHFHLGFTETSMCVKVPWKISNLLPQDLRIKIWALQNSEIIRSCESAVLSGNRDTAYFDLESAMSLTLETDALSTASPAKLKPRDKSNSVIDVTVVELKDKAGNIITVLLSAKRLDSSDYIISICPQMVLVNWTELPLVWGRCKHIRRHPAIHRRLLRAASSGTLWQSSKQTSEQDDNMTQITEIEEAAWQHSSIDEESQAWNSRKPPAMIFSCPDGPDWDPCVCVKSANQRWERIAHDMEEKSNSLSGGHVLQRISVLNLGADIGDSKGRVNADQVEYEVGVERSHGAPPFHRTLYINIMPRVTVVNHSGIILQVRQEDAVERASNDGQAHLTIASGTHKSALKVFRPAVGGVNKILVRQMNSCGEAVTRWSKPFEISRVRHAPLLLSPIKHPRRNTEEGDVTCTQLRCEIKCWSAAFFVHFLPQTFETAYYAVHNDSPTDVKIQQQNSKDCSVIVKSGERQALAWQDVDVDRAATVQLWSSTRGDAPVEVDMDNIGLEGEIIRGELRYQTTMLGCTHLLVITAATLDVPAWRNNCQGSAPITAVVSLKGFGLSLVNKDRKELMYGFVTDFKSEIKIDDEFLSVDIDVGRVQVDNQTNIGRPVVFACPCDMNGWVDTKLRCLKVELLLRRSIKSMRYWKKAIIIVGEINTHIEELWLHSIKDFEKDSLVVDDKDDGGDKKESPLDLSTGRSKAELEHLRVLSFLSTAEEQISMHTHFEKLELSQVTIYFSVFGLCMIPTRPDEHGSGPLESLYNLLRVAGSKTFLPDVNRSSITLSELTLNKKSIGSGDSVFKLVSSYYTKSVMLAALATLGSPDLWASFLENAAESLEERHERQKLQAEERASSSVDRLEDGLRQGFKTAGHHFYDGLAGALDKPVEGFRKNGLKGWAEGAHHGAVGLVTKPMSGTVLLVSKAYEGITALRAGGDKRMLRRTRDPRPVFWDKMLRVYNEQESALYGKLVKSHGGDIDFVVHCPIRDYETVDEGAGQRRPCSSAKEEVM